MTKDGTAGGGAEGRAETVSGTAWNAKAGAVLEADDGRVIYVEGVAAWPDSRLGERVTVTGVVRRKQILPQPRKVGGMTLQGMTGTPWVIEPSEPLGGED